MYYTFVDRIIHCQSLRGAVEYMKDLQQKIDNLKNELESTSPGSSLKPTTGLHPLTPTPPTLPSHINDEVPPSPNGQAARVEASVCDGKFTTFFFVPFTLLYGFHFLGSNADGIMSIYYASYKNFQ